MDVATGAERNFFAFGNGKLELFNERCFVVIGDDGTFPFFHSEYFFRYFDVHVGFDVDLTRQTAAFARFALLMWDSSVGRMSPPPLFTTTRH